MHASSKQRRLKGQDKFRLQSADLSKESNDYYSEQVKVSMMTT